MNFTIYKAHTYNFKTQRDACLRKLGLCKYRIKYIDANSGTIPIHRNLFKRRYRSTSHNQLF